MCWLVNRLESLIYMAGISESERSGSLCLNIIFQMVKKVLSF